MKNPIYCRWKKYKKVDDKNLKKNKVLLLWQSEEAYGPQTVLHFLNWSW